MMNCMHEKLFIMAEEKRDAIALIYESEGTASTMTYGQLADTVRRLATRLKNNGVKKGDLVAVRQERGPLQVISIYAVLMLGAVYVPINVRHPEGRVKNICQKGNIKFILTECHDVNLPGVKNISADNLQEEQCTQVEYDSEALAYIIFTSGSTGEPKGVMITHKSAMNTIEDINSRFDVTEADVGLNLSEIDFDLSVYDFFGILGCGAKLVLLGEDNRRNPEKWLELMLGYGITVWNSVPAIYEMMVIMAESKKVRLPLKKIFLSGDWIDLELPDKTKKLCNDAVFISLGGATEASIWSNFYKVTEVNPQWKSIPYGQALTNQELKVVREDGSVAGIMEEGELHIGGAGVALGYLQDDFLTRKAFYQEDGKSWYKTGDLAMLGEDGNYIILGRIDYQVKIKGYRIELGEIENVIHQISDVDQAVCVVNNDRIYVGYTKKKENANHVEYSCIECVGADKSAAIARKEKVAAVMGNIMKLSQDKGRVLDDFKGCNGAYRLWIDFLVNEGYASITEQHITATEQLKSLTLDEQHDYEILRKVFYGKENPNALLDHPDYTPEHLILKSDETAFFINDYLQQYLNKKVSVAVLDARTGLVAAELQDRYPNINLTLFDNSIGMLTEAKEFLKDRDIEGFVKYPEYIVSEELAGQFDLIISVDTLHTWKDAQKAMTLADKMLKANGRLLALEYGKLDPMGMLTSGLIEDGFKNTPDGNPFKPIIKWSEILEQSNLSDSQIISIQDTDSFIITAQKSEVIKTIDFEEAVKDKLTSYMLPYKYVEFMWYPLTENGKVDRKKITELFNNDVEECCLTDIEGTKKVIWDVWKEMLGTGISNFDKTFFELGGDSLLATKTLIRLQKEFDIDLTLGELLENSTINQLAELIDDKLQEDIMEGEI